MKKIISLLLVTVFMLMMSCVAFADYPKHLNGDPNYILAKAKMGWATYVIRNSLDVNEYNPPEYVITVNTITVGPNADQGDTSKIYSEDQYTFGYIYKNGTWPMREDTRGMYIYQNGEFKSLDFNKGTDLGVIMIGEIAFYLAYGIPFFGDWIGLDDSFYNGI